MLQNWANSDAGQGPAGNLPSQTDGRAELAWHYVEVIIDGKGPD